MLRPLKWAGAVRDTATKAFLVYVLFIKCCVYLYFLSFCLNSSSYEGFDQWLYDLFLWRGNRRSATLTQWTAWWRWPDTASASLCWESQSCCLPSYSGPTENDKAHTSIHTYFLHTNTQIVWKLQLVFVRDADLELCRNVPNTVAEAVEAKHFISTLVVFQNLLT